MHGSVFLDAAAEVIRPALLWNDQRTDAQCEAITERVGANGSSRSRGTRRSRGSRRRRCYGSATRSRSLRSRRARPAAEGPRAAPAHWRASRPTPRMPRARCSWTSRARHGRREVLDALEVPRRVAPADPRGARPSGHGLGGRRRRSSASAARHPGRGRRRRQRGRGDRDGGDRGRRDLELDRHERGRCSRTRTMPPSTLRPDPRVRARRARRVLPAGRHPLGGRLAPLVARRHRARLRRARRRGRTRSPRAARGSCSCRTSPGSGRRTSTRWRRGAFVGLTARHTRGHLTRAIMEGVAFSLRDGLEIMRGLGSTPRRIRAIGGGADVAALARAAGRRVRRAGRPARDRGGRGLRRGVARARGGRNVRGRRRGD